MSELSVFLRENAADTPNVRFAASERFVEDGEPVFWEIRCISGAEDEELRKSCIKRVPSPRARGQFISETDINLYLGKLAALCTVYPNLREKSLQDSYGVMGADSLLKVMLTPGEYAGYLARVQEICGFDQSFQELVDDAKN